MTRKHILFASTLMGGTVLWAGLAQAQDAQVDELIVTGSIVGSQRAAIAEQRNADNLVSVIAADTVGQFPDQNSAAALARIPSVAVQRDQGQERYIQVRGAPNRWTSVSIDGINAIGVDEGGGQRAFRFDAVPAVILSALEVNKSLTPDMTAEAIVARVNLRTFSPFDKAGFALTGDVGLGEMNLGGGQQEQYAARASWSGDQFGVIIAGSHYSREQVTDNREFAYDDIGPTILDIRSYRLVRESNGGLFGVEYRPNDDHRLFAKSLYTEFKDNEQRDQYVFQLSSALSGTRGFDSGDLVGVPYRGTFNDGYYGNSNWLNTIGGDHQLNDWSVEWRLNYTETENTTELPLILAQQGSNLQRASLTYDKTDAKFPTISLATTVPGATAGTFASGAPLSALNQTAFPVNIALPLEGAVTSESYVYKIDAARDAMFGATPVTVRLGAEYDDRTVSGNLLSQSNTLVLPALLPRIGATFSAADYVTDQRWTSGFARGFDVNYVDNKAMRQDLMALLDRLEAAGLYNPAANNAPDGRYEITEKLLSAYGSAKWEIGAAQIVAGARVERFEQTIDGFVTVGTATTPAAYENEDTSIFPSINVKYDLDADTVLRVALSTGIARPSFGTVRAGASINDIGRSVTGGNPTLEPERTIGLDGAYERYLTGAGLASVSAFYRSVDNVLYDAVSKVTDDRFDATGVDRTGYDYTTTLNGGRGKLYGLELAYLQQFEFLPGAWSGLGFQGNVTFLKGDFETQDGRTEQFPGTSERILNTSVFYEKYGLSARLSYQWRDDWQDTIGGLGSGEFRAATESLDLSLRYAVNDRLSLFLDANNLTDEVYVAYEGSEQFPTEVEQIGARWMAGIRFTY
ncbi:TonB-dependent receptor [Phenylobacterium sp.]|uniref:TonB-dependent receptor n=1 Tax=Phenylobacterium sp. TaxID=1871053 RepID=UPI00272FFBD6|nr:TonB-dependent receptor [Phenylobacterium sp.]MDP1616921.1 TonB-dependent receptor [Phenylobacterium sp.]MDP1987403.1 TonB-dependent receptor [Phenylobacterium sp.]